jgi:hypothetical protein
MNKVHTFAVRTNMIKMIEQFNNVYPSGSVDIFFFDTGAEFDFILSSFCVMRCTFYNFECDGTLRAESKLKLL